MDKTNITILVIISLFITATGIGYGAIPNMDKGIDNGGIENYSIAEIQGSCSEYIRAPNSIEQGNLENNNKTYIFYEGTRNLSEDVSLDITESGFVDSSNELSSGSIDNGTLSSYTIHFDKVGTSSPRIFIKCSINFQEEILGVITTNNNLYNSDTFFGAPNTYYSQNIDFRGLELGQDNVSLDLQENTVTVGMGVEGSIDQVRIITKKNVAISSSFNSDNDGWKVVGDAQGSSAQPTNYFEGGVNNSGYISATDDVAGGVWYWSAPSEYLGNKSHLYGESLSYYLNQSSTSSQFNAQDIIIEGEKNENNTLVYDFGDTSYHPDINWTPYQVQLDQTDNWKIDNNRNPATEEQFKSILSNISRIWIRGEYVSGGDTGGLDEVIITGQTNQNTETSIIDQYDTNNNGIIDRNELRSAILDLIERKITRNELRQIIINYVQESLTS